MVGFCYMGMFTGVKSLIDIFDNLNLVNYIHIAETK